MSITVFISYARIDEELVKPIYDYLSTLGVSPWMDIYNLIPGENWEQVIQKTIKQADVFLAILSRNSVSRRGVIQKELKIALDKLDYLLPGDTFVVPIKLDDCQIPERLSSFHALDWAAGNSREKLQKSLDNVKRRVKLFDTSMVVSSFLKPALRFISLRDTVANAVVTMDVIGVDYLPVLNEKQQPVGIVSKRELMLIPHNLIEKNISDIISAYDINIQLYPSDTIISAINLFSRRYDFPEKTPTWLSTVLVLSPESKEVTGVVDVQSIMQAIENSATKSMDSIEEYMTPLNMLRIVEIDTPFSIIYANLKLLGQRTILVSCKNEIVGMVTDTSLHFLVSQVKDPDYLQSLLTGTIMYDFSKSILNSKLYSTDTLNKAVSIFARYSSITALPVFDNKDSSKVIGMISYLDIFRYLLFSSD